MAPRSPYAIRRTKESFFEKHKKSLFKVGMSVVVVACYSSFEMNQAESLRGSLAVRNLGARIEVADAVVASAYVSTAVASAEQESAAVMKEETKQAEQPKQAEAKQPEPATISEQVLQDMATEQVTKTEPAPVAEDTKTTIASTATSTTTAAAEVDAESRTVVKTPTVDPKDVAVSKKDKQKAVVHMGLLGKDSAVIKETMRRSLSELGSDGYELPTNMYMDIPKDAPELGFCFYDRETYTWAGDGDCAEEQLADIQRIADRGSSTVLTSDNFAVPFIGIEKVKEATKSFDETKIIAYYTRFYEYVYGIWEQLEASKDAPFRMSFPDWTDFTRVDQEYRGGYTLPAIFRWKKVFDDVELFNMYDPEHSDLSSSFFCHGVTDATNTCNHVKSDPVPKKPERVLIYEDMAYYAKNELGLLKDWTWEVADLTVAAQRHQEEMGRSLYDFPAEFTTCPDEKVLKSLLDKTIHTEKHLFKKYFRSTGEQEIRDNFEADKHGKLCFIDAKAILEQNEEWIQFFKNLGSAQVLTQ